MRIFITLIAGLAMLAATLAFAAEPLTTKEVSRFVETLPEIEAFGDELEASGKSEVMAVETAPVSGEPFMPYSSSLKVMKEKFPAEHRRLGKIVSKQGFTPAEWAATGDRVMVAYLALKMQEEDPRTIEMMQGMDESMIDMMPPEVKAQMERAFAMMDTVKKAPEADKKAVAANREKLDAFMDAQSEVN